MKQIIYKCLNQECKIEFKGRNKEGLGCPICKSVITPYILSPTIEELENTFSYEQLKGDNSKNGINELKIKIMLDDTKFKSQLNELEEQLDRVIEKKKLIENNEKIDYQREFELMVEARMQAQILAERLGCKGILKWL